MYTAVRAHEVMLNEATAAQERSVIPPLLTLNGGAAAAFLTLLGAKGSLSFDLRWARLAIVAWMVGLLLAAFAGWAAASRQTLTSKAHRLMREQVEADLFGELAEVVALPEPKEGRDKARANAREAGRRRAVAYKGLWLASAGVFVAGGIVAMLAVTASPEEKTGCGDTHPGYQGPVSQSDCARGPR